MVVRRGGSFCRFAMEFFGGKTLWKISRLGLTVFLSTSAATRSPSSISVSVFSNSSSPGLFICESCVSSSSRFDPFLPFLFNDEKRRLNILPPASLLVFSSGSGSTISAISSLLGIVLVKSVWSCVFSLVFLLDFRRSDTAKGGGPFITIFCFKLLPSFTSGGTTFLLIPEILWLVIRLLINRSIRRSA